MIQQYAQMRQNISMLGHFLGETICDAQGDAILQLIENIRVLSKNSRNGDDQARQQLLQTLSTISDDNIIPVARAFSQFLNLTNIAEQYQTISRHHHDEVIFPIVLLKPYLNVCKSKPSTRRYHQNRRKTVD